MQYKVAVVKVPVTPALIKFLIVRGYSYCLSRTECDHLDKINITLSPVTSKPILEHLPQKYDTFFDIKEEPRQMAEGIDDTVVWINLKPNMFEGMAGLLFDSYIKYKTNESCINN